MAQRARLFAWKSVYETEIAEMDEQHRELAAILNTIHRAIRGRKATSELLPLIDVLITHTVMHFATEERLMKVHAFPKASHHKLEHALLRTRALNFRRAAETETKTDPAHLLKFLECWLDKHMQGPDQALAAHLRSCGSFR